MKIKFKPRKIKISSNPTFIIGENPGKPLKSQEQHEVWRGNRCARLINEAIKGKSNIYLTNIYNWYFKDCDDKEKLILDGISELKNDLDKFQPTKIICLGQFAFDVISNLDYIAEISFFSHPSYIFRFNKNKKQYIKNLRKELNHG